METTRVLLPLLALICLCFASCFSIGSADGQNPAESHAHDVYFELKDPSDENRAALVAGCWKYLSEIDGIRFFAAGSRDHAMDRSVNDQAFDVSLHVFFVSQAAQDVYDTEPRHLEFIEEFAPLWKSVRVFDSKVSAISASN